MSTAIFNQGDAGCNEEEIDSDISITESQTASSCSSFRCILNEESPDLNNPGLYNCEICKKGFIHRSRKLFQEEECITTCTTNEGERPIEHHEQLNGELKTDSPNHNRHRDHVPNSCATTSIHQLNLSELHLPITETNTESKYSAKCDKCQKHFKTKSYLRQHNVSVHGIEAKFICSICYKGFLFKNQLINHLCIHQTNVESKYPFKCDKCPSHFSYKYSLREHNISKHGAKTKFICSVCKKGFGFRSRLATHSVVHKTFLINVKNSKSELPITSPLPTTNLMGSRKASR